MTESLTTSQAIPLSETCLVRKCNASDIAGLALLLDRSFTIKNPEKEALVRWKFFDAYHAGQSITYAALNDAGEFVAQYTNFPIQIRHEAGILCGMVCADMTTRPDYRGQGLISQLARRVYEDVMQSDAALSIGYSNEAGVKVDQNARGYGYRIVGRFERYARLLSFPTPTAYLLTPTMGFDDMPLSYPDGTTGIAKTRNYLTWRYMCKPMNDYQIYRLTHDGTFAGYVILRESSRRAYVYDIIADMADIHAILAAIQNLLIQRHKRIVILYVLANPFWQQALRHYVLLPRQWGRQQYYLTVKLHQAHLHDDSAIRQPERWRLMAGDIL